MCKGLKPGNLRFTFGTILCALLLFFAVATKLAGYYAKDASVKPIAAAKVWQHTGTVSVPVEKVKQSPALLDVLAVMLSLVLAESWYLSPERPSSAVPSWFSPYLAVRPPPSL